MKRIISIASILALLFTLVVSTPVMAKKTQTLIVDQDGSGDYETIQEALDEASPGDTVIVHAGIYTDGTIVILKNDIHLIGEPGAVLQAPGMPPTGPTGIRIGGPDAGGTIMDVSVEGFTIKDFQISGILIGIAKRITVKDNIIENSNAGISLILVNDSQFLNNEIDNMTCEAPLKMSFGIGPAFQYINYTGDNNLIKNNTISNIHTLSSNLSSAVKLNGNNNEITGNFISNSNSGVNIVGDNNQVIGNTINGFTGLFKSYASNEEGINVNGNRNVIKDNVVSDYHKYLLNSMYIDGKGILLDGSNNEVDNNKIVNSDYGIVGPVNNTNIVRNTIDKITYQGIGMWGVTTNNNLIEDNEISHAELGIFVSSINTEIINNQVTNSYFGIAVTGNSTNIIGNTVNNITDQGIGIWGDTTNNNIIEENKISMTGTGIGLGGINNTARNNNITDSISFGINTYGIGTGNVIESNKVSDGQGTGIFISGTNQDVQKNHVINCEWGIAVAGKSTNIIGNNIDRCRDQGIGIWTNLDIWGVPEHNLIDENNISICRVGIGSGGSSNTISNNKIKNVTLHGISIWPGSDFNTIDGNLISRVDNETDNGIGISILGDNNTIQNNSVFHCDMYGIAAFPIAEDNDIQWNTVLHNGIYDLYAYIPENNVWIDNIFDTKSW